MLILLYYSRNSRVTSSSYPSNQKQVVAVMTDIDISQNPLYKSIPLTQGKSTIVDADMYDFLNQWKWHYSNCGYAVRSATVSSNVQKTISMHRVIINAPDGMEVDHRDTIRLHNWRDNLRLAYLFQNSMNKNSYKGSTSKFKGVSWKTKNGKWQAQIRVSGKCIYIGIFNSEIEAALAYNEAAKIHHGEFARLNEFSKQDIFSVLNKGKRQ